MTKKPDRRGLGRGLSVLLAENQPLDAGTGGAAEKRILQIPIEQLNPNPDQPRKAFNSEHLDELTASIQEKGVLQPLIVRTDPADPTQYQIVAGERRWRAAQKAQLHELPAILRDLSDTEVLEIAIIENIQRADLNPVEEAAGYKQLMDTFGHTQDALSKALGKSRSHIANSMRLLSLPPEVLDLLRGGKLTAGHARALITADDPAALARQVINQGLTVRQTEALAKSPAVASRKKASPRPEKDADTRALEADLSAQLRLRVFIDHRSAGEGGELKITYRTLDDLDRICQLLSR